MAKILSLRHRHKRVGSQPIKDCSFPVKGEDQGAPSPSGRACQSRLSSAAWPGVEGGPFQAVRQGGGGGRPWGTPMIHRKCSPSCQPAWAPAQPPGQPLARTWWWSKDWQATAATGQPQEASGMVLPGGGCGGPAGTKAGFSLRELQQVLLSLFPSSSSPARSSSFRLSCRALPAWSSSRRALRRSSFCCWRA